MCPVLKKFGVGGFLVIGGCQSGSGNMRPASGSLSDDISCPLENRTADSKVRFFPPHQRNYEGYAQALKNPP